MQDIGIILKTVSKEESCSVFDALLKLLDTDKEEKEDVCVLQSESSK